jgi:hypothetical protein
VRFAQQSSATRCPLVNTFLGTPFGSSGCHFATATAAKRCTEEGVNQWASRRLVRFAQQSCLKFSYENKNLPIGHLIVGRDAPAQG